VRVYELFGERKLVASGFTQSRNLNKRGLTGQYWDGFIRNLPDFSKDSRFLILGLGGGTIAKLLTKKYGLVAIDGVEVDPLMVELGRKYLDFDEKNVNVFIEDALKFIKHSHYKYDMIAVDLYAHGDNVVGTASADFFEKVRNITAKDGVVVVNKIFDSREEVNDYLDFIGQIFDRTEVQLIRNSLHTENVLVYAYV
jgi:spermidine synthase